MSELAGKTVLVTGASKGIGAAIVRALGAAGANVIAHYSSDRAGAENSAAPIPADRKCLLQGQFSHPDSVEDLWRKAVAWQGRIDVLVNNAAVLLWHGGVDEDEKTWDDVWARTLQVNLLAPARLMRQAVRHFREQGGGTLVTISSWVAQRGVGNPDILAYGASKAALRSLTQSIARHYGRDKICAYIIAPGVVDTQMSQEFAATQPGGRAAVEQGLAMGEWVPPEDVANLVTYLSSGRSRHLSGATLDVNGASYIR